MKAMPESSHMAVGYVNKWSLQGFLWRRQWEIIETGIFLALSVFKIYSASLTDRNLFEYDRLGKFYSCIVLPVFCVILNAILKIQSENSTLMKVNKIKQARQK